MRSPLKLWHFDHFTGQIFLNFYSLCYLVQHIVVLTLLIIDASLLQPGQVELNGLCGGVRPNPQNPPAYGPGHSVLSLEKHPTKHNSKTQDQLNKQRITQNLGSLRKIITHYHIYHLFNFKGAQVNFIAITTSDVLKFNS